MPVRLALRVHAPQQPRARPPAAERRRWSPLGRNHGQHEAGSTASIEPVSEWPAVGARVVVWTERTPSRAPREPREAVVDHAAAQGLVKSSTRELDGERLDVDPAAFDAVISRLGLIYFPNQAGALARQYRALRPLLARRALPYRSVPAR
jgi:hypothetical protein